MPADHVDMQLRHQIAERTDINFLDTIPPTENLATEGDFFHQDFSIRKFGSLNEIIS